MFFTRNLVGNWRTAATRKREKLTQREREYLTWRERQMKRSNSALTSGSSVAVYRLVGYRMTRSAIEKVTEEREVVAGFSLS